MDQPSVQQDPSGQRCIILGTAGHIDHGKTALVKALTGIDTDRLAEERRRGITIELGFAHLSVGDTLFGIVDVPGHERFIKSMVAGAGGIDLVLLVVAADEGVMPQTREHLDICQLLGVRHGLVALTKVDLVEPEWIDLVREDLLQVLQPTFLHGAPIVGCSTTTGEGLDTLRQALLRISLGTQPRDPGGLLRLPLDRVFTIKGFGTVVTGTLLSGTLQVGDEISILPATVQAKVRGIQVHGREVPRAVAGQRTAVNLGGVDRHAIARGEVLIHPETLAPSVMIDASILLLPGTRRTLPQRSKVLFHIGTRQQEATCILLDSHRLEPGSTALAQLSFEQPVVALPTDRFILRGFSKQENYGTTIGGGQVLRVLARRLRPRNRQAVEQLTRIQTADPHDRVALELLYAGPLTRSQLQQRVAVPPSELETTLSDLRDRSVVVVYDEDSLATVHAEHFAMLRQQLLSLVESHHQDHPLEPGVSREELRSRLGAGSLEPRLFSSVLQDLADSGRLVIDRQLCRLANHTVQTAARSLRPLADRILAIYEGAGLGPPRDASLASELNAEPSSVSAALRLLVEENKLQRISSLYFARRHVEDLRQRLQSFLEQHQQITPPQFKDLVGQSRKFTIPLAEHFDATKVTLRVGDVRKLRR